MRTFRRVRDRPRGGRRRSDTVDGLRGGRARLFPPRTSTARRGIRRVNLPPPGGGVFRDESPRRRYAKNRRRAFDGSRTRDAGTRANDFSRVDTPRKGLKRESNEFRESVGSVALTAHGKSAGIDVRVIHYYSRYIVVSIIIIIYVRRPLSGRFHLRGDAYVLNTAVCPSGHVSSYPAPA